MGSLAACNLGIQVGQGTSGATSGQEVNLSFQVSCITVSPDTLDFGDVSLNTTAKASVMLIDKCTVPVTGIVASVTGTDANLFVVDNAPSALAAGSSATVNISYSPIALETRSMASVVFSGSDGGKGTLTLFGEP